jgi:hypothetical protein
LDPIAIVVIVAYAVYRIIRLLAEDGVAHYRGLPSPQLERRRLRAQLAREHLAAYGTPPLTMAISNGLARRIATRTDSPPERRAWATFRTYIDDVLADTWEDAHTHHEQRRQRRMQTQPNSEDSGWRHMRDTADGQDVDDDIVDAELVEPEPDPGPEPEDDAATPPEDPPPPPPSDPPNRSIPALPAPDPTRKDSSVTNTINGDVGSPAEALAFCEQTLDLNKACCNEIDIALAGLRGAGCGQGFLDIITGGLTAADIFDNKVRGASVRYAKHVLAHADLTSNPDLKKTLLGYLSADKV